ncbi:ATP-binding protein [uncultured Gilvimarinus sp.]|uniref:ATP-binding protein n=1 Tax=uncultured Gilvimarinus sp. TaxID=1689143 RepID=UPI0030ECD758
MTQPPVTLDNCHEEPIHIPGSIQPHGYLLVIDETNHAIVHASENCSVLFDCPAEHLIGKPVGDYLGQAFSDAVNDCDGYYHSVNPYSAEFGEGQHYDVIVRDGEGQLLLDIECRDAKPSKSFEAHFHSLQSFLNSILQIDSVREVFQRAAVEVRAITGFDRVMVYQFDEDYNGEVIAEEKVDSLNSFYGQHFPESDIPAQARLLYLKNRIRLLADVDATPSPIVPSRPVVDLSFSSLRSVSPIHCQYLRNMGVAASMSISITIGDKLWGLIACHHYSPKVVPFRTRETAAYLGLTLSHFISVKERQEHSQMEAKSQRLLNNLLDVVNSDVDFFNGLKTSVAELMALVGADGVAYCLDGSIETYGDTPGVEGIEAVYACLSDQKDLDHGVFSSKHLSGLNPDFARFQSEASGALLLCVDTAERQFIIWFKKEIIQTKNWGGKPEKHIEFTDDGSHRLMPRTSFALWQENVRGHCYSWQLNDKNSAIKLRNAILSHMMRRAHEIKTLNQTLSSLVAERTVELREEIAARESAQIDLTRALAEATESNAQLEQFAYVASHDLQEPLRKIQSFGSRVLAISKDQGDQDLQLYTERMVSSAGRMQTLIKDVLNLSRIHRSTNPREKIDLNSMLDSVLSDLNLLVEETQASIEASELGTIEGEPNQVYRLLQNLIQNAIKFHRPGVAPVVRITKEFDDPASVTYKVQDNGIGFDMDYKDKVFDLFERLNPRGNYKGTGLGLAICKRIMDNHSGAIWAVSQEGQGTSIFFRFDRVPL